MALLSSLLSALIATSTSFSGFRLFYNGLSCCVLALVFPRCLQYPSSSSFLQPPPLDYVFLLVFFCFRFPASVLFLSLSLTYLLFVCFYLIFLLLHILCSEMQRDLLPYLFAYLHFHFRHFCILYCLSMCSLIITFFYPPYC